jgi:Do/DeqQ family serine protease
MNFRRDFFQHRSRVAWRLRTGLAAAALVVAVVFTGWSLRIPEANAASAAPPAGVLATGQAAPSRAALPVVQSYADVVSRVSPAVVTVRTERHAQAVSLPFGDGDNLFQQFFGNQAPRTRPQPGAEGALGSGVIVSLDGYILTNYHVVDGAEQIKVDLNDRRTFDAKLVGSDPPSDLAVLKINATGLPTISLGNSDHARVGDVVLAFGNPMGVGQTVTMGIISAKGRATGVGDDSYEDFLQTDAPINQGNSGGPLVNLQGQLVGINSQILTPSGGSVGIGFAIPASMAGNVMDQLIKDGRVRRSILGVTVQSMNSDVAASLGLKGVDGALVGTVEASGPAARAGMRQGDVITKFNGEAVTDSNSLRNRIAGTLPGTRVTLDVVRDGRSESVTAVLAEKPAPRTVRASRETGGNGGRFGMSVEPITPDVASQLGIKDKTGLAVTEVAPMSPAANAGLQPGDVIKEVNRKPVATTAQLQEVLNAAHDKPALLLISRKGTDLFLALAQPGA